MLARRALSPRVQRSLVAAAAALICGAGMFVLGRAVDPSYPVEHWLIWHLLPIWAYALLLNGACVAFGAFLGRRLLGDRPLPALERLLHSMVLGLVAFVLAWYLLGFIGLFKPGLALGLPLLLLGIGLKDGRALLLELVTWRATIHAPKPLERVLGSIAVALGAVAIAFLYLEALNVSAINFDATWYHFPIAQDYARTGRIIPFPGENHRAYPHLTSMLHTWALLVPRLPNLSEHWMLSLHLEFTIVLWRVVAAATLARWLLGGRDVRGLWAGFFLFPSVFVYDQSIGGSADHFLGFFAVPIVLAAARALERFDVRWCVLLGVALGGHLLVKYQSVYLFGAVGLAVVLRLAFLAGRRLWRARRQAVAEGDPAWRAIFIGLGGLALTTALVSAPHFGKNTVFYRNPVYPFAQSTFASSYPKRGPGYYEERPSRQAFEPKYDGWQRQLWALRKVFDFSLTTANRNLTKRRPYMGALFSMLLPCALLVPGRRRSGFAIGICVVAIVLWANLAANDRYLLSFLDICIGLTLSLLVKVWDLGWLARAGLVPLVLTQLIWGGDAMLYYGRKQLEAGLDLIGRGFDGKYDERFGGKGAQRQITAATPPDAVILARNYKGLLGLDRTVLSDIRSAQDYVSYAHLKDTRAFYELVKSRGVTHLLYPKGERRPERYNNLILFTDLATRFGKNVRRFGKLTLCELPAEPPPPFVPYLVLTSGVKGVPEGIYLVEQLDFDPRDLERFSPRPKPKYPLARAAELLPNVQALLIGRRRMRGLDAAQQAEFEAVEAWDDVELHLRRISP